MEPTLQEGQAASFSKTGLQKVRSDETEWAVVVVVMGQPVLMESEEEPGAREGQVSPCHRKRMFQGQIWRWSWAEVCELREGSRTRQWAAV